MPNAIRFHATGDPGVLRFEEVSVGKPGPGQVRIRQTAVGVNYIDIYQRSGLYPVPLPCIAGSEAAGEVVSVGPGVTGLKAGDRVAYTGVAGAYCEERLVPAEKLVALPDGIKDTEAAASLLKGLTVHYLTRSTYPVKRGDTVLWHAAAGGVGLIACQWLKAMGVTVIGTVGSDAKAKLALEAGAAHVIRYDREDFAPKVRKLTGGAGVPVVYDPVGKTTWEGSLDCLSPRGMLVSFGNASGAVGKIDPLVLSQKGSLFLTRPTLGHHLATREELLQRSGDLFQAIENGTLKVAPSRTYLLSEAAKCHRDLESRSTSGSMVLLP